MEMPEWLKTVTGDESRVTGQGRNTLRVTRYVRKERNGRFLDKTLHHVISFIEDTLFNESISKRNGLLQVIEPRLKVITLLSFIVILSLQKSIGGIAFFFFLSIALVFISKIPPCSFLKKLLPAMTLTIF